MTTMSAVSSRYCVLPVHVARRTVGASCYKVYSKVDLPSRDASRRNYLVLTSACHACFHSKQTLWPSVHCIRSNGTPVETIPTDVAQFLSVDLPPFC